MQFELALSLELSSFSLRCRANITYDPIPNFNREPFEKSPARSRESPHYGGPEDRARQEPGQFTVMITHSVADERINPNSDAFDKALARVHVCYSATLRRFATNF
jgi:hypothetical protein